MTAGFGGAVYLNDLSTGRFTRGWLVGGTPRHGAFVGAGVLVVTNNDGWVDFLQ